MNCGICNDKLLVGVFNNIVGCHICKYVFEKNDFKTKIIESDIGTVYERPFFNDEFSEKLLFSKIKLSDFWHIMKTMKVFI